MKTKKQLKDVFSGVASLWYQSTEIDLSNLSGLSITPELDVPVKVDSINLEQGDPSIEHYKVVGLPGDWVTSAEAGDIDLSFRVPTKDTEILSIAYGADAVKDVNNVSVISDYTYTAVESPTGNPSTSDYYEKDGGEYIKSTDTSVDGEKTYYTRAAVSSSFSGTGLVLTQHKVDGTFILVNDNKDQLLVLANTTLWAKPVLDQDAKGVFALDFNGSIESDGSTPDILFLTKL